MGAHALSQPFHLDWRARICSSYSSLVGGDWFAPELLDAAPDVVLCHDCGRDPVFVYANHAAAALWERQVDQFIGWPSRLTAPPQARKQRAAALSDAAAVTRGYHGTRVASSGRLFQIQEATVWPVLDGEGVRIGQAATFSRWVNL